MGVRTGHIARSATRFTRLLAPTYNHCANIAVIEFYKRNAYMWRSTSIAIEIVQAEGHEAIVAIDTPAGRLELMGTISIGGRVLTISGAHVQGLEPGRLGRTGLNAIGRALLDIADVDQIIIQGGVRTTGRRQGRRPRAFRFPHS